MAPIVTSSPVLFDIIDIFGKRIRITRSYWKVIKEKKHRDLRYSLSEVAEAIHGVPNQ